MRRDDGGPMVIPQIMFSLNTGLLTRYGMIPVFNLFYTLTVLQSFCHCLSYLSKRPVSLYNVRLCIINRSLSGPML